MTEIDPNEIDPNETEPMVQDSGLEPEPHGPLDELADAILAGHRPAASPVQTNSDELTAVLEYLIGAGGELNPQSLRVFSDLSAAQAEQVRRDWPLIPAQRREAVLTYLTTLAEEELDLHLGPLLRVLLGDSEPTIRRLAMEGLWEDLGGDLIGPLVQLLYNDEDAGVRAAAAQALGPFVLAGELDELDTALSMRAEEALLAVLLQPEEDTDVRRNALESIAYSGEMGVRQLIEDAYYDADEAMRVSALTAMGRSADIRWRGLVRAELLNPSPAMRGEAARACGELDARAATPELITLLEDEELFVRLNAIAALGQIGGKEAREALRAHKDAGDVNDPLEDEAVELALEELLFSQDNDIALFDEDELLETWEDDPWDLPYGHDDDDLGEYSS
ncbi:MAG: HEAT repeat domain-containing protein [Caldilineaceae bacterium]|nr:HEAT repeat domain-containing protein [Caldilineaceae bacterium]